MSEMIKFFPSVTRAHCSDMQMAKDATPELKVGLSLTQQPLVETLIRSLSSISDGW